MTQVPIAFFQVAAAAIPTLMVAIAVGMKHGEGVGKVAAHENAGKGVRALMALVLLTLIFIIAWGEMLAVLALAQGQGSSWQGVVVFGAITVLIYVVVLEYTAPVQRTLGRMGNFFFNRALTVICVGAFAVFAYALL